MPSPIAHIAAGVAVHRLRFGGRVASWQDRAVLLACMGLSLLPDADAAVGIALGNLGRYHNNFAGSPFFGVLVTLAAFLVIGLVRRPLARPGASLVFLCYQLHVFMDFFTISRGSMLLWPLSTERFSPPFPLFFGLRWSHGLVSELHLVTLGSELFFAGLLWLVVRRFPRRGPVVDPLEARS